MICRSHVTLLAYWCTHFVSAFEKENVHRKQLEAMERVRERKRQHALRAQHRAEAKANALTKAMRLFQSAMASEAEQRNLKRKRTEQEEEEEQEHNKAHHNKEDDADEAAFRKMMMESKGLKSGLLPQEEKKGKTTSGLQQSVLASEELLHQFWTSAPTKEESDPILPLLSEFSSEEVQEDEKAAEDSHCQQLPLPLTYDLFMKINDGQAPLKLEPEQFRGVTPMTVDQFRKRLGAKVLRLLLFLLLLLLLLLSFL